MLKLISLNLIQLSVIKKLLLKNQANLQWLNLKINITDFMELQSHLMTNLLNKLKKEKWVQLMMLKSELKDLLNNLVGKKKIPKNYGALDQKMLDQMLLLM